MKPSLFIFSSLLVCLELLPLVGSSQPFLQSYYGFAPDPDASNTPLYGTGYDVTVSAGWMAIGAINGLDPGGNNYLQGAGSVYIYDLDAKNGWGFYQKIVANDRWINDRFGYSVSLNGESLLVSAPFDEAVSPGGGTVADGGSVYFFEWTGIGGWQQMQQMWASDANQYDFWGQDAALDGDYALVGAPEKKYDAGGGNIYAWVGAAYLLARDSTGVWLEKQIFHPINLNGEEYFGSSVSIHGDWAAVGAPREDEDDAGNYVPDAGTVYLYHRDSLDRWNFTQQLVASDREIADWFGNSVDVNDSLLIVGAMWEEDDLQGQNTIPGAGAAYIFQLLPSGQWQQVQKLVSPIRDWSGHFGYDVQIEDKYAVVSQTDYNQQSRVGEVFLFEQHPTTGSWTFRQQIIGSSPQNWDHFGAALSLDHQRLVVGAPNRFIDFTNYGAFYLFEACEAGVSLLQDTICPGTSYFFAGQYLSNPGTYTDTLETLAGCDSTLTLDLVVQAPNLAISESDSALAALAIGASYQWLDCGNGNAEITGASEQVFSPPSSGQYAVAITQYGCTDTSACVAFIAAGKSTEWESQLHLFPNPSRGSVQLVFDQPQRELSVRLFDLSGKRLLEKTYSPCRSVSLELPEPRGIYFLEIHTESGEIVKKLEKQ